MYPQPTLYINGQFLDRGSRPVRDVVNPATWEKLGELPLADESDLQQAIAAARNAFDGWRHASPLERSAILRHAARLLRERADDIARGITMDNGKPLAEAVAEVTSSAEHLEWNAEEGRRIYGRVVPPRVADLRQLVVKEPIGVCAAFTPWNFPLNQAVKKVAAALGAGCTLILKGPEESPSAVMALVRALHEAGLPPGVLNAVWGVPPQVSRFLIESPDVRKISFTGSVPVGKQLAALAGAHMKRTSMELGGHSPVIVCADADIRQAATLLARYKFRNAGQACVSPTRFYVQREVHDDFVAAFTAAVAALKVGNGMDAEVQMGPLIHERRVLAMEELVTDAVRHGAAVAAGGSRLGTTGHFYAPTILTGVPDQARIMNEEPFGPVAPVTTFTDTDDVLRRANRLPFGLAAYVFTTSLTHATRLSNGLEAGMVNINHSGMAYPELPFGGIKESGFGSEGGLETFDAYLTTKMITQIYPQ